MAAKKVKARCFLAENTLFRGPFSFFDFRDILIAGGVKLHFCDIK
jgi:hypothetical protein